MTQKWNKFVQVGKISLFQDWSDTPIPFPLSKNLWEIAELVIPKDVDISTVTWFRGKVSAVWLKVFVPSTAVDGVRISLTNDFSTDENNSYIVNPWETQAFPLWANLDNETKNAIKAKIYIKYLSTTKVDLQFICL